MNMPPPDRIDAITIGETMALFVSHGDPDRFIAMPAGAESNVAMNMARLGCRTRWISRLGDDPLGRLVEERVAAAGVEVDVVRDPSHPTGVMTKHVTGGAPIVGYYRSQSAARELSPADLDRLAPTRWIHVTGITPAISESARDLVAAVMAHRIDARVSFDVNLRAALWPDTATASAVLLDLARRADVVFIGDDEADLLVGGSDAATVGASLLRRDGQELVLKRGGDRASVLTGDGEVFEPALDVAVVDLNGAGDAFAAGYLAGHCFGWQTEARLRLAHVMGARAVGVAGDTVPPFTPTERAGLTPEKLARRWQDVD
jgi:2-dehydro-3-deoxygluconokinase